MPSNAYKSLNGTSMATPVVSGLAGLLKALDPTLSDQDIYMLMVETATESTSGDRIGRIVNARKAVQSLLDS
jgi:subtilisin family serine protease